MFFALPTLDYDAVGPTVAIHCRPSSHEDMDLEAVNRSVNWPSAISGEYHECHYVAEHRFSLLYFQVPSRLIGREGLSSSSSGASSRSPTRP